LHLAMKPGKRKVLGKTTAIGRLKEQLQKVKASVRARVEHLFRVTKRQFGHVKFRYCGLVKNTEQLKTLFSLSYLWLAREKYEYWIDKSACEAGCGLKRPNLRPLRVESGLRTLERSEVCSFQVPAPTHPRAALDDVDHAFQGTAMVVGVLVDTRALARVSTRPGWAPVELPCFHTMTPLTMTASMPRDGAIGCS